MSDVPWVCGACRSINQPRESRCYRCRTPRDLGEVDPTQLITAGAGSKPEPIVRPMGPYRDSATRALLTQGLIVAALVATVISSFLGADLVGRLLDEGTFDEGSVAVVGLVGLTGLGLGIGALIAWSAWLSRVVANVPTLGLGWPNVTPTAAIYESIFPVVNLYRVPSILRDIVTRLEPGGRGEALIAAAWLALVGGVIAPRLLRLATTFLIGNVAELQRAWIVVNQLGLGLTVAGGAFLVVLIQWIETRMAARARALPVAAPGQPPAALQETPRAQTIAEAATGSAAAREAGVGMPPAAAAAIAWQPSQPADQQQPGMPSFATGPASAPGDPGAGESAGHHSPAARPRWGGTVAAPEHLSAHGQPGVHPPAGPGTHGRPIDRDDLPIGTDGTDGTDDL